MKIFLLFFLIGVTFMILLFKIALQVKLICNSDKKDIKITLLWLDPFLKAFITLEDSIFLLNIHFFNKLVYKRKVKGGTSKFKGLRIIQLANPKDVHVDISYGFRDPFTTGIACGAINIALQFINIDYMNQLPDFTTDNDYIYLDATANVNLGSTIINMIRA